MFRTKKKLDALECLLTSSDNIERAEEMIMEDRRTTVDMVSVKLVVSHGSELNLLDNELGF